MKIDPETSKELIRDFIHYLDFYEIKPEFSSLASNIKDTSYGDYVMSCLNKILNGEDPADAFNLKRGHRATTQERDICIAINYAELRDQGIKAAAANLQLQNDWGLKEDSIKRIYKKYKVIALSQFNTRKKTLKSFPKMQPLWDNEKKSIIEKFKGIKG